MLTDEEIYALKWAQKSEKYTSKRYVEETDTKSGYYEDVEVCADNTVAFARAVIEANNAKVLADLKPVAYRYRFHYPSGPMDGNRRIGDWKYIDANTKPIPESADCSEHLHSADQVSALIQDRDALAARVKELEIAVGILQTPRYIHFAGDAQVVARAALKATP